MDNGFNMAAIENPLMKP